MVLAVVGVLAMPASVLADPVVVGDPGSSTITVTAEEAILGGVVGIDPASQWNPIGPVSIDQYGAFQWPGDDLTFQLAGSIADQEIANLPLTYTLSISNAVMQGSLETNTDVPATVNPVTQVVALDVVAGFNGTFTADLTGDVLGGSFAGTASCSWPNDPTTVNLSTTTLGATPYSPATGTFTMSDKSIALTPTISCNYVGVPQDMRDLADPFIRQQLDFPDVGGYLSLSGTISPAPQPAAFGEITARPEATGTAREGHTLTCTAPSAGLPIPTVSYVWQRDEVVIADATAATYRVRARDAGHGVRCGASATNIVGSGGFEYSLERTVPPRCVVPNVAGTRLARARARIRAGHCRVGDVRRVDSPRPRGDVTGTRPAAGTAHPAGRRLTVLIAR